MAITRIIGIDPGSCICGYGIIEIDGQKSRMIDAGPITLKGTLLPSRLAQLHRTLTTLLEEFQPDAAAIEQVFFARNPDSALKLGQARGAALAALAGYDIPITEYSPRSVKQSVTGSGAADKHQVQQMISVLLSLPEAPQEDAADALAIAMCHANHQSSMSQLGGVAASGRNQWRGASARRRGGRMWRLPE